MTSTSEKKKKKQKEGPKQRGKEHSGSSAT